MTYYLLRHHTLALTQSKRVYSFGCEEQGQLGHGEEGHPSVPLPVQLPQGNYIPVARQLEKGEFKRKKGIDTDDCIVMF